MMFNKPKDSPSVAEKLSAPNKKSIFERQKAEAEAKRLKEQQETAAVYADFVRSFDNDEDEDSAQFSGRGQAAQGSRPGPAKRHFTTKQVTGGPRISGPGSLGPTPGSASRKRTHEGNYVPDSRPGLLGFDDSPPPSDTKRAFHKQDSEDAKDVELRDDERAGSKPTLHLSNMPPSMTSSAVKALLPSNLGIDSIKTLPQDVSAGHSRESMSALVMLAPDTPAGDIDTAVSALQNKYLGWGFKLNLSRHLSSAAIGAGISALNMSGSNGPPFGAKPVSQAPAASLSRAPPPVGMGNAFAPPASYGPSAGSFARNGPPLQVEVIPPADLRQLRLIHKTVENVITHGPEFEALLMSRPSVQREERWAWLWDARSQGGVWYRWRLWDITTGATQRMKSGRGPNDNAAQYLFQGGAVWQSQERALAFEYDSNIADFVSDSEYDSSEDEESGDEGRKRLNRLQGGALSQEQLNTTDADAPSYLNPLQKAKLVHLLARLPNTTAKLRRGDVARITAFAIRSASEGANEVVDLITSNVHLPFNQTRANPERKSEAAGGDDEPQDDMDREKDSKDVSSLKLISLYVISDILSSSSTSGVRHAWRYRQLFENALRKRSTFAHLGRLEKELSWGRLRAEKFKRSVNGVLSLWEGWCAFPAGSQEEFAKTFNEPPLTEQEKQEVEKKKEEEEEKRKRTTGRWKTVDEARDSAEASDSRTPNEAMDIDGDANDGEPMEDEDLDGEPMAEDEDDEDIDGEPMIEDDEAADSDLTGEIAPQEGESARPTLGATKEDYTGTASEEETEKPRMRRPKAEDMFADSDGE